MSASKVQLIGGSFQDPQGNVLANGYLTMMLSSDEEVNDSIICSGIQITIQLDANGNVITSPPQYVWGNDVMLPVNSYYKVTGYTSAGQISFGPNNQQCVGSPTFDAGSWIPNSVISWSPSVQPLSLEVAGTALSSQTLLDLVNSGNVTFTDIGNGQISASVPITPPPPAGLPTPDQSRFAMWYANFPGGGAWVPFDDNINAGAGGGGSTTNNAVTSSDGVSITINNSVAYNGAGFIWPTRKINFLTTIKVTVTATSLYYAGLTNIASGSGVTDPTTGDSILVGYVASGVSAGNWLLVTSTGGVKTVVDSGVAIVQGTRYAIKIIVNAGTATLYINGTAITTNSTLPTANALNMAIYSHNGSGSGQSTTVEYMYADSSPV
jgi:hypothetical protein